MTIKPIITDPKLNNHTGLVLAVCAVFLTMMLSGCAAVVQDTINTSNRMDQSRDRQKLSGLLGEHIREVQEMRAQGNPMGDYLWAYAHDNGLIPDAEKDPERITAMYQAAADKGLVDAELKLALRRFNQGALLKEPKEILELRRKNAIRDGKPVPLGIEAALKRLAENPQLERTPAVVDLAEVGRKEVIWRSALAQLEKTIQKQCFYYRIRIFAPTNTKCLMPSIAADDVWHGFRDDLIYRKDNKLRDLWLERAMTCEASAAYQQAAKPCNPGPVQRVKGRD